MRRYIYSILILIVLGAFLAGSPVTNALSCFLGVQGGTGICSTTSSNVDKVLTVSSTSPFTYYFSNPTQGFVKGNGTSTDLTLWTATDTLTADDNISWDGTNLILNGSIAAQGITLSNGKFSYDSGNDVINLNAFNVWLYNTANAHHTQLDASLLTGDVTTSFPNETGIIALGTGISGKCASWLTTSTLTDNTNCISTTTGNWIGTWQNKNSTDFLSSSTAFVATTTGNWLGTWQGNNPSFFLPNSASSTFMWRANNGSDINSTSTFRSNLGLTDTALLASSTWAKVLNNLSDLQSTSTARSNLGLTDTATLASSTWLKVSNNLSDLQSTSTARTNIGYSATSPITLSAGGAFNCATCLTSAIISLNGSTSSTQTFATSGPGLTITTSNGVHTFSIPTSTASVTGLLSSADWTTFNNKGSGTITTSTPVTTGYFPYWGTSSALTGTSSIYQTGGQVGIGTTTPQGIFTVASSSTGTAYLVVNQGHVIFPGDSADGSGICLGTAGANPSLKMYWRNDSGTARLELDSCSTTGATSGHASINVPDSIIDNSNRWIVNAANNYQKMVSGLQLGWSSSATDAQNNAPDVAITRQSAGVLRISNNSSGFGKLDINASSTPGNNMGILIGGHIGFTGTAPTSSACGVGPTVTGNDNGFTVGVGTGVSVTSCTVTFNTQFTNTPVCTESDNSVAITGDISAVSTSSVTFSFSAGLGGGQIYAHCTDWQ